MQYLKETSRPKSGIIVKKSKVNRDVGYSTLLKQIKTEILCSVVDCSSVSVKQAHKIVKEKFPRLDISLTWVQNLYSEMGFAQEKKMTEVGMQLKAIRDLIEKYGLKSENNENGLNQLQLLSMLEKQGMKITRTTLQRRLKELQNCN